jgi:hypothetical protein
MSTDNNPNQANGASDESSITATLIAEATRLDFLPRHFKGHMMEVENHLYAAFGKLCPTYRGGYWHFNDLSNGGCYLAPSEEQYALGPLDNGFEGTVSGDAAGIIVTLYTLSNLSFLYRDEDIFSEHFHRLRAFALKHTEHQLIFAAID